MAAFACVVFCALWNQRLWQRGEMLEVLIVTIYFLTFVFSHLFSAKGVCEEQIMMDNNLSIFPVQKDR